LKLISQTQSKARTKSLRIKSRRSSCLPKLARAALPNANSNRLPLGGSGLGITT